MATQNLGGLELTDHMILQNVAEDIKVPLVRILAHVQLADYGKLADREYIEVTASSAVKLMDSYLLSSQIYNQQQQLALEPVSVAAIMGDVVQQMSQFAKFQNRQIEFVVGRKLNLVMASRQALHAALTTLLYGILQQGQAGKSNIVCSVSRHGTKIRCGIFNQSDGISSHTLSQVRRLHGRASRPAADLQHGTSSALALADGIISAMGSQLHATKTRYGSGLVADFLPSTQLVFL